MENNFSHWWKLPQRNPSAVPLSYSESRGHQTNKIYLSKGLKEKIFEMFKEAVYTDSKEKLVKAQEYLCALGLSQFIYKTLNFLFI